MLVKLPHARQATLLQAGSRGMARFVSMPERSCRRRRSRTVTRAPAQAAERELHRRLGQAERRQQQRGSDAGRPICEPSPRGHCAGRAQRAPERLAGATAGGHQHEACRRPRGPAATGGRGRQRCRGPRSAWPHG
jgi:hypothetical protein